MKAAKIRNTMIATSDKRFTTAQAGPDPTQRPVCRCGSTEHSEPRETNRMAYDGAILVWTIAKCLNCGAVIPFREVTPLKR
jgi:hypothetical protein